MRYDRFMQAAKKPAVFLLLSLFNLTSYAVENSQLAFTTEEDFLSGIPIVLTATRLSQPTTEAPSSITVIDQAMIRASGAREIPDLFRLVPGFQVGMFTNNTHVVTSHGLVGNYERRTQVLIDGRSVYITLLNTVDWATLDIDIEDIERIEVIRGSNSPVYGANAFSGVINIITKQPFLDKGTAVHASVGASRAGLLKQALKDVSVSDTKEALDARKLTVRHGGTLGDVDYRITVGYREDEGFRDIYHKEKNSDVYEYEITNDGKKMALANLRATYNPSINDILDLDFGISHGPMGAYKNPSDDIFDQVRDKEMTNHHQSIKWTRAKGSASEWQLHFYHNYYKQKDTKDIGTLEEVYDRYFEDEYGNNKDAAIAQLLADTGTSTFGDALDLLFPGRSHNERIIVGYFDGIGERYDLELQHTNHALGSAVGLKGVRLVAGAGVRYDRLQSQALLSRSDYVNDLSMRVFGNLEWRPVEKLAANVGAMVEHNEIIGTYASPRAALNLRLSEHHMVRGSLTRAYRTPSLLENNIHLGPRFAADNVLADIATLHSGDLDPEEMTDLEFGYIFDAPEYFLTFDAKLFHEWIRDGILDGTDKDFQGDPFPGDDREVSYWDNVVSANIKGLELQLRYRPFAHTLLALNYGYAECTKCTQERYRNSPGSDPIRDISETVPKHTASALVSHRFPRQVDVSLAYYHVTEMKFLEEGFHLLPTIDRFDARVAKLFRVGDVKGEVAALLQNFTGEYNEFNKNYFFEPRAFLDLSVSF